MLDPGSFWTRDKTEEPALLCMAVGTPGNQVAVLVACETSLLVMMWCWIQSLS